LRGAWRRDLRGWQRGSEEDFERKKRRKRETDDDVGSKEGDKLRL